MNQFAFFLLIISSLPCCLAAQDVTVPKIQIQKDVWIANAKYNIDTNSKYQLIAIADALDRAYKADPSLTSSQFQTIVHDAETNLKSWQASQGGSADPSAIYQQTLSLMADATSNLSFKAAAAIGKDLLAINSSAIPEDDWRTINAFRASEFSVDRGRESDVLESVYNDASASPTFQTALDQTLGSEINGLTTETAATLLDHNPGLSQSIGLNNLQQLVSSQGNTITFSLSALSTNLNAHLGDMQNVIGEDKILLVQMNKQQADMNAYVADAVAQQKATAAAQAQQKLDQLRFEAADAAFQIFGKIIPGKAGQQVAAAGQVAVKVASSISDFVTNTSNISSGLGAAVLTGNLLGAAMSFSSIFAGGPSQMDLIQQQLSSIAHQIDALQSDMDNRLTRIDNELAQIYDQQSKAFVQVLTTLNTIQATLGQVQNQIFALSQQLSGVETQLIGVLEQMDQRAFYNTYNEFLHYYETKKIVIGQSDFINAEKEYAGTIISGNTPPEVTVTQPAKAGDRTITQELRGPDLDNPSIAALRPEDINFVLNSANAPAGASDVINPYIWTIVTSAYLDLANQPMLVSNVGASSAVVQKTFVCIASKADQFIASGSKLKAAITQVPLSGKVDAPGSILGHQFITYYASVGTLFSEARKARAAWVQNAGFDPWLAESQEIGQIPTILNNQVTSCQKPADAGDPSAWGVGVSIQNLSILKGTFANASHYVDNDQGFETCLTNVGYSSFKVGDQPERGLLRYGSPANDQNPSDCVPAIAQLGGVPCSIHHYNYLMSAQATVVLRFDGVEIGSFPVIGNPWLVYDKDLPAGQGPTSHVYEIQSHWSDFAGSIQKSLDSVQLTPSPASLKAATIEMRQFLAQQRVKLISEAWLIQLAADGPNRSSLRIAADAVTDNKTLIWALAQIGIPTAFDEDQRFRSYVSQSPTGLLDRMSFIGTLGPLAKANGDITEKFDLKNYQDEAYVDIVLFRSLLDQKIDSAISDGGDVPQAISGGLAGLEKLQDAYTACQAGQAGRASHKSAGFWRFLEFWKWF